MPVRLFAMLAVLFAAPSAQALEACLADSVGPWRGPVYSSGELQTMISEFHALADGALEGSYHILDAVPYDGTLTGYRPTGPCEAEFSWTDRYGTGVVQIRFEPALGRFLGLWGQEVPLEGHIFRGYRRRSPNVS